MKPIFIISESSHVPGKGKSSVSNVFSHAQPCPCSMYTRNQKQKGLKTRSHWDKKNRFGQIRGKEATRDKEVLEESSPLLPCL